MKYRSLEQRLDNLSIRILNSLDFIKKKGAGKHLSDQLARCSISFTLNYAEARFGFSKKDFIYKLSLSLREMNEAHKCLFLIRSTESATNLDEFKMMENEADQLVAILAKSVKTARENLRKENSRPPKK